MYKIHTLENLLDQITLYIVEGDRGREILSQIREELNDIEKDIDKCIETDYLDANVHKILVGIAGEKQ